MSSKKSPKLECPISYGLDVIGDPWSMLVIRDLMILGGVRRFDELCEGLGISRNILTERLLKLVEKGVVEKQPVVEGGRRMEYRLTQKGWDLMPLMLMMLEWTLKWEKADLQNYRFVDKLNGKPIRVGEILSEDGRSLSRSEIQMVPMTDEALDYLRQGKENWQQGSQA